MRGVYGICLFLFTTVQPFFLQRAGFKEYICVYESSVNNETDTEKDNDDDTMYNIDYEEAEDKVSDMLGLNAMDKKLSDSGIGTDISFTDIMKAVRSGSLSDIIRSFIQMSIDGVFSDLSESKELMVQLIGIALLGSVFINISGSFGSGFIAENGFYVTYLIMTSLMLASFTVAIDMVCVSIERILMLIRIVVPVYALAMNYVGHSVTSAGMYEVILVGVWLIQVVILKFVIPLIKFYVIVSLVNNLNKEDSFSKLCVLIQNMVSWLLRTVVVFIAGLNIIKSLIEPQIDAMGRNTINRVVSAIPGGSIMSVLTGTFLGAGLVIKNCIGVAGILLLMLLVLLPIVKMFLIMFMVRITGAVIQPIGEKRYVEGVEALSGGMRLLLQTIGSSVVLFMLTLAIMAYASNGGG